METRTGKFTISAHRTLSGELRVAGRESLLVLHDDEFFHVGNEPSLCITGRLNDLMKVTLVDCVKVIGTSTSIQGDVRAYSAELFPNFVLVGRNHLNPDDRAIRSIDFTLEDGFTLFYDFDAFGSVIDPAPHIQSIVRANDLGRTARIGSSPLIAYFAGERLIANVQTALGDIRVEHRPQWTAGGPRGVRIDNEIWLRLLPDEPINFHEAIERTLRLLRFLELIAGRPQSLPLLRITTGDSLPPDVLEVHWSHHPRRSKEHESSFGGPHPADLPLDPIRRSAEFANVLSRWLAADSERLAARSRFHNSFALQSYYTVDRLIGAANSFDLLPESAVPDKVALSNEIKDAKDRARDLFTSLPHSFERSSMLGAIGRLGTASLKQKVRHRIGILLPVSGSRFPEIERVCDHAVDCRNHFVHGSQVKLIRGSPEDNLGFLTDTLEFVFGTSELVEAGWDALRFMETPTSMSHPFGLYRVNYADGLRALKEQLPASPTD